MASTQNHLDTFLPREDDLRALSEAQLRQIYDEEEVERFLFLFSAYVTEIRLSPNVVATGSVESDIEDTSHAEIHSSSLDHLVDCSLSKHIAYNYVLPHLPPASSIAPTFTLKRFTLTIQRLYLALFPPYQVFFSDLVHLALWEDYHRSLRHCIVYWFLWFHDLLLPALIFRIVFGLLRHRLWTYPTLKELQERRHQTARAQKFGEAVQHRLSVTTIGPIEMWNLFKLYKSGEKDRAAKDTIETDEEENLKRDLLFVLNELADVHERIKSIFTWRRPDVSCRYLFFLTVIGFGTAVLPAKWIAKLVYWFGGILFWHITPIIAALPRAYRARVLPLFRDAPTDADHAMELIAERIATGQDVDIASLRNRSRRASNASTNTEDLASGSITSRDALTFEDNGVNWKKWSERVARGKLVVEEGRRFLSHRTSRNQISGGRGTAVPVETEEVHTFLAQYNSFPGLITLTPCTLFFTSLTGSRARLVIPRDRLRGVKRTGLMRGISITWASGGTVDGEEKVDKFHWVGSRDELFARLSVGSTGGRWITPETVMFFSPELLSKRDSGFGLLWLAATLGSKSAFKKLPKRSVMTADISQLCRLIATPAEPLALRLSSNLLVGAARVYRVKQEIFMSDVTTCFNSLKRVEHELRSMISSEGQLQMAQPSVKSSAVTLRADPKTALAMDFDAMVADWDEYLNPGGNRNFEGGSDFEYRPTVKSVGEVTGLFIPHENAEPLRANTYTLPNNNDFLLADSFNASFGGSGTAKVSSSQIGAFAFDDTFDGLDIEEGVGDDLVRELGEGWGVNLLKDNDAEVPAHAKETVGMNFDTGDLDDLMADGLFQFARSPQSHFLTNLNQDSHVASAEFPPSPSFAGTTKLVDFQAIAHAPQPPPADPTIQQAFAALVQPEVNAIALKKPKRGRPILDARTELTDEELKATRMHYLDKQNTIRCELEVKRFDKRQIEMIHTLLWDTPGSLHAQELVDFWAANFKAHVEARASFVVRLAQCLDGSPHQKRRRISASPLGPHKGDIIDRSTSAAGDWCAEGEVIAQMDGDSEMIDFNYNIANWGDIDDYTPNAKNQRSSEEPGQARQTSHLPMGINLGINVVSENFHSQRSALFPWDMAGNSSPISTRGGTRYDRISVEHADDRLRGSSASRRGSSLPSLPGNPQTSVGSPVIILPALQSDDDFVFDVPGDNHTELRLPEANRVALEKNSHNFLEYAKMQHRSLPSAQYLVFDDVVPKATSTARVAAAALYHCLVLATKDLLRVNQEEAYGHIDIRII